MAKTAVKTGRSIRDIVLARGLLDRVTLDRVLSVESMTRGGIVGADGLLGRQPRAGRQPAAANVGDQPRHHLLGEIVDGLLVGHRAMLAAAQLSDN